MKSIEVEKVILTAKKTMDINTYRDLRKSLPVRDSLGLILFVLITFGVTFWASRFEPGL